MNENTISINNSKLSIRSYNGKRVVTFKDIDTVHGRPEGTAGRNFRKNKEHFIEGVDYFKIQPDEIRRVGITSPNGGIVLTESGYLMLAKSFTDDLAWKVQRELVNSYFRGNTNPRHEQLRLTLGAMGYRYFAKTWRGVPIITMNDFAYFTGIIPDTARCFVEKYCKRNTEYYLLKRAELAEFRLENPEIGRKYGSLVVMTKSAVDKLVSYYGCADNAPPMIEEKRALPTAEAEPVTANRKPRCVTTDDAIVALEVLRYVKEHNESCKRYDHVAAIEKVIKDVGMLIAAGY